MPSNQVPRDFHEAALFGKGLQAAEENIGQDLGHTLHRILRGHHHLDFIPCGFGFPKSANSTQHCIRRQSLVDRPPHQRLDEVLGVRGDVLPGGRWESQGLGLHVLEDLCVAIAEKRRHEAQQHVQDDAAAPHVTFLVVASTAVQHFGSDVIRGTQRRRHLSGLARLKPLSGAKVNEHNRRVPKRFHGILDHHVLELQVPVRNALRMQIADRPSQLFVYVEYLHFCQSLHLANLVEKLAPVAHLENHVNEPLILVDVEHPADVRVVQLEVDVNLVCHEFEAPRRGLLDSFHRADGIRFLGPHLHDSPETALADGLALDMVPLAWRLPGRAWQQPSVAVGEAHRHRHAFQIILSVPRNAQ
mmetsp:Transcript_6985/g.19790  ORF Transcript_6985/g.19790 Transcript_6985/m.19790 type:complete len:359 (+) Transcript_6985:672-1748(+)